MQSVSMDPISSAETDGETEPSMMDVPASQEDARASHQGKRKKNEEEAM